MYDKYSNSIISISMSEDKKYQSTSISKVASRKLNQLTIQIKTYNNQYKECVLFEEKYKSEQSFLLADSKANLSNLAAEDDILLINSENIQKNWQYRKYMTNNANNIREYNYLDSANSMNYTNRPYNSPVINSNIFKPTQGFNNTSIRNDSDLKNIFLNKQNNGQFVQEIK